MFQLIIRYFKNGNVVDEVVPEKNCYSIFKSRKKRYGTAEIICSINGIEYSPL